MTDTHKLASLDALRGLAILLVIVAHFAGGQTGREASIIFANAGVILFFFLSGFLMDLILGFDRSLISYATRRAFRILPMYWLSLFLIAAWRSDWTLGQVLSNATFTAPVFKSERMLGVYWTLYIEILFYCIAPFLRLAGDRAIQLSTYVAVSGFIVVMLFRDVGTGAPFYLIFCLCGMQIGAWHRGTLGRFQLAASIMLVSICFGLLLPAPIYLGLVPLGCAALLVTGVQFKIRSKPLQFFGAISYSWYLLHSIFGYSVLSSHVPQWSALLLGAASTLVLSMVTYICIERPAILAGKTIIEKWRRRAYANGQTRPLPISK
jgi:peptidoglycan/LPS O-acetylase OafA/YrhL